MRNPPYWTRYSSFLPSLFLCCQVPHLDARAATLLSIRKRGVLQSLFTVLLGALDVLRTQLGLSPIYLPLVGPAGSLAFMQLNDFETREYFSKHPQSTRAAGRTWLAPPWRWRMFVSRGTAPSSTCRASHAPSCLLPPQRTCCVPWTRCTKPSSWHNGQSCCRGSAHTLSCTGASCLKG